MAGCMLCATTCIILYASSYIGVAVPYSLEPTSYTSSSAYNLPVAYTTQRLSSYRPNTCAGHAPTRKWDRSPFQHHQPARTHSRTRISSSSVDHSHWLFGSLVLPTRQGPEQDPQADPCQQQQGPQSAMERPCSAHEKQPQQLTASTAVIRDTLHSSFCHLGRPNTLPHFRRSTSSHCRLEHGPKVAATPTTTGHAQTIQSKTC